MCRGHTGIYGEKKKKKAGAGEGEMCRQEEKKKKKEENKKKARAGRGGSQMTLSIPSVSMLATTAASTVFPSRPG